MPMPSLVIKVGGSLFDLPDLATRLRHWLATCGDEVAVLIPGGGATTDAIRAFDACHALGDDKAHWLAIRALTLNAHFLADLLPGSCVVQALDDCAPLTQRLSILDPFAFARWDEDHHPAACLPHSWDATSDSLAARVAVVADARRLILLKSTTFLSDRDLQEAVQCGFVDTMFAQTLHHLSRPIEVQAINLRTWSA